MKLFIVLSVLSVLALVAAQPVQLEEVSRTNNEILLRTITFEFGLPVTYSWTFDERYVITRYQAQLLSGAAMMSHVSGGVGYNYLILRFDQLQPNTRFRYRVDIWGSSVTPSSDNESEISAGTNEIVEMIM